MIEYILYHLQISHQCYMYQHIILLHLVKFLLYFCLKRVRGGAEKQKKRRFSKKTLFFIKFHGIFIVFFPRICYNTIRNKRIYFFIMPRKNRRSAENDAAYGKEERFEREDRHNWKRRDKPRGFFRRGDCGNSRKNGRNRRRAEKRYVFLRRGWRARSEKRFAGSEKRRIRGDSRAQRQRKIHAGAPY